jgi:hypothetical protein
VRPSVFAAATLAALVLATLAPAVAAGGTRGPAPAPGLLDVGLPAQPVRDVVIDGWPAALRAGLSSSEQRYPVNDGKGRTVAIAVSPLCNPVTCNAADPRRIAEFLGTLVHGHEISSLTVELVTTSEISSRCGFGAGACYFPADGRMLINGSDTTGPDGATRNFVIAHEYGHHVERHGINPPFGSALDWGTKRWATYERVCQGVRRGAYFPGDEGDRYFQNPGEAFAEAFAFNRFRRAPVRWAWSDSLEPGRESFRALRADTLLPWRHRTRLELTGRVGERVGAVAVKRFRAPLDGVLSVRLSAAPGSQLDLLLRDRKGRLLASSRSAGAREQANFVVCGQTRLRAAVERRGAGAGAFTLVVRRP